MTLQEINNIKEYLKIYKEEEIIIKLLEKIDYPYTEHLLKSTNTLTKFSKIYNFINDIIDGYNNINSKPEWGFPKGRRLTNEKCLDCAIRETIEETGISKNDFEIKSHIPYIEIFNGLDGVKYKHVYYLSELINHDFIEKKDSHEIGDIKWMDINELLSHISSYNERINIINKINLNINQTL